MENEISPQAEEPKAESTFDPCAEKTKKEKKGHPFLKTLGIILLCIIFGGAAGIGTTYYMNGYYLPALAPAATPEPEPADKAVPVETPELEPAEEAEEPAEPEGPKLLTNSELFSANVNSTVGITTSVTTTNFWGYTTTYPASGSGFIVSEDGHILTNYHVIEDSSDITVTTYDGSSYEASVVGFDETSDIAVLKIEAEELVPVVMGNSSDLSVGEEVVAIGNPLGELTFTMTRGIVSALDRTVTLSGNSMKLIQTDCAINSGNSGGALFNMYGEVVGITNAKFSSSTTGASIDNIGFAIPIDSVKSIYESIMENGYVSKPYIGISIMAVSDESIAYGLPAGIAIQEVTEDSPAAEAELQPYDIITAVNGTEVVTNSDLTDIVSACAPGDVLELEIYRKGETLTVSVTVGEKIQTPETVEAEKEELYEQFQDFQQSPESGNNFESYDSMEDFYDMFGQFFSFFN